MNTNTENQNDSGKQENFNSLVDKTKPLSQEKKLQFDPITGNLVVSDSEKSGAVVVDQIYKDGFFHSQKVA